MKKEWPSLFHPTRILLLTQLVQRRVTPAPGNCLTRRCLMEMAREPYPQDPQYSIRSQLVIQLIGIFLDIWLKICCYQKQSLWLLRSLEAKDWMRSQRFSQMHYMQISFDSSLKHTNRINSGLVGVLTIYLISRLTPFSRCTPKLGQNQVITIEFSSVPYKSQKYCRRSFPRTESLCLYFFQTSQKIRLTRLKLNSGILTSKVMNFNSPDCCSCRRFFESRQAIAYSQIFLACSLQLAK